MIGTLVTRAFWAKAWEWCKINWKFLLGVSIPIIISILMRRGNAAKIFRKASEARKQQLEVLQKAHDLESSEKERNQDEFLDAVNKVSDKHEETLKKIAEDEKEALERINSAEKATAAIKKKLEE